MTTKKKTILLTGEEIQEVRCWPDDVVGDHKPTPCDYIEAGSKAQLKNVVEWGEENCIELGHQGNGRSKRRHCYHCWQALLKEAE